MPIKEIIFSYRCKRCGISDDVEVGTLKEANKIMSKDDGWLILKNEEYCHDCKNSVDACDN